MENLSYFYSIGKSGKASYSPTVFKAYDEGDKVASGILDENMAHVAHLASTTLKHFHNNKEPVKIAVVGGLTKRWDVLYPMIEKHLKRLGVLDMVKLEVFVGDVVQGALLRAGAPMNAPKTQFAANKGIKVKICKTIEISINVWYNTILSPFLES